MDLGLVGLGKMGGNMRERLRRGGHRVVGFDRDPKLADVESLAAMVSALPAPRAVWVMVPSGAPTEATIEALAGLLAAGDVLVDGGNSNFRESIARGEKLAAKGIGFVDAGTSGGIWGLTEGYCIMVGGSPEHVARLQPIFDTLVAPEGFAHVGRVGAGHFTKMVHNGVEYGMMQAYGEGYELLQSGTADLGIDVGKALEVWRHGSVVRSWLLDLLNDALKEDPGLSQIAGVAADSGEGRWTVEESIRRAVPLHVISAALYARFTSRQDDSPAMKAVAALRNQFGGHAVQKA
ncbi:MAG: decarboxylating 6-phosphogluconate dehydrogenase [Deltaproteobacteria bacterium]|nr:decarboxylating 6-phosphogluconate dehydrogenase [Deltaproteobacteria bacterium]